MPVDAAFERLRNANPVPRPDLLRAGAASDGAHLSDLEQRRRKMQTDLKSRPRLATSRGRWTLIAAAVAVVAIGFVAVFLRLTAPDGAVANSPSETATVFLEAVNTYDTDASSALLSQDAVISDLMADSVETWAGRIAWGEAVGLNMQFDECATPIDSNTTWLTCAYTYTGGWSKAAALDSSGTGSYAVKVESGEITFVSNVWLVSDAGQTAWLDFIDWVDQNHPGDLEIMFTDDGLADPIPDNASAESTSVELWGRYMEEFAAGQTN